MNILQLSKYYYPQVGGIELVAKMISKAHLSLGDDVSVLAFGQDEKEYLGKYGEKVIQINQDLFLVSTPMNFSFFFKFLKFIDQKKIDKIYVHLPNPFMHQFVHFYKRELKRRRIVISAVYHSDLVNQKYLGPIYSKYFSLTADFYDEFICSSEKLWNSSCVLKNFSSKKKRIIPFCIEEGIGFKKREHFKGNLVAIGRLVPYKGFEFLIDAINDTPYHLTIIGDGPIYNRLKMMAKKNIRLMGRVSDNEKSKIINQSDVLVVSSINRSEAYGMIIVEAFENGLPVVAANIDSGVTFLASHNERGKIFEIENKESLLGVLQELKEYPEHIGQYSTNARDFFEKELSFERFKFKLSQLKLF